MGAAFSVLDDPSMLCAIRVIPFDKFVALGRTPRYPEDKDLTVELINLGQETYNNSLIVFISHCWLRGWSGAEGWDGRAHPDTISEDKYKLCVKGIQDIMKYMAPRMDHCYIWLDYGCIDQNADPAGELKLLDKIVMISDCIFTPIHDTDSEAWELSKSVDDWFKEYKSSAWNGNQFSYLNRGWCRIEMFYAAHVPILPDLELRGRKFRAGFAFQRDEGRRPHLIYGTKQFQENLPPIILPPLQYSYFDQYHPEKGCLTKESDRIHIQHLVEELQQYIKEVKVGYEGDLKDGKRHGEGKMCYDNGDVYVGEWESDVRHGKGKLQLVTGGIYQGMWENDLFSGKGVLKFSSGAFYEGDFKAGKYHGKGKYTYPDDSSFQGIYENDLREGKGLFIDSSGKRFRHVYEHDRLISETSY